MKNKQNIIIVAFLQFISFIYLFVPTFTFRETSRLNLLQSYFISIVQETEFSTQFSIIDILGTSRLIDFILILFLICLLMVPVCLFVLYRCKLRFASPLSFAIGQVVFGSFVGVLTTCTIETTLKKSNAHYYLRSLFGVKNYNSIIAMHSDTIEPILQNLYGQQIYDYAGQYRASWLYIFYLIILIVQFFALRSLQDKHPI